SPVIRTVESVGATLDTRESSDCKAEEVPTISSNIDALAISSRRATFSCWSLCSACLRSSTSVPEAYQRVTCPCPSRSGLRRKRNQRYVPSYLRKRASISCGDSFVNLI